MLRTLSLDLLVRPHLTLPLKQDLHLIFVMSSVNNHFLPFLCFVAIFWDTALFEVELIFCCNDDYFNI